MKKSYSIININWVCFLDISQLFKSLGKSSVYANMNFFHELKLFEGREKIGITQLNAKYRIYDLVDNYKNKVN